MKSTNMKLIKLNRSFKKSFKKSWALSLAVFFAVSFFSPSGRVDGKNLGKKKLHVEKSAPAAKQGKHKNFVSKTRRSGKNEVMVKEGIKRPHKQAKSNKTNKTAKQATTKQGKFYSQSKKGPISKNGKNGGQSIKQRQQNKNNTKGRR